MIQCLNYRNKGVFIDSQTLINRLKLLVALPLVVIFFSSVLFVKHYYNNLENLNIATKKVEKIEQISILLTNLQKERGFSSGFSASGGVNFKKELLKQRQINNRLQPSLKKELFSLRQKVDNLSLSTYQLFILYTKYILKIQKEYIQIANTLNIPKIRHELTSYTSIVVMKESCGEMRGIVSALLANKNIKEKKLLLLMVARAKGQYNIARDRYLTIATKKEQEQYHKVKKTTTYTWVQNNIESILLNNYKTLDPYDWFLKTTQIIQSFNSIQKNKIHDINQTIERLHKSCLKKLFLLILTILFISFFMLVLGLKLKNSILKNIELLHQYKDIVDRSSIVSKTDIHGRITYANDKFCNISGFSREELIGKAHNIVRHQDMPKAAFKDMWQTILAKKPWFGVVKNRKKNGDYYVVEATISPILDDHGNIEEFIALRTDITEQIKLQEEIETTQEEFILKIGQIGETRSKETGFHVKRVAEYSEILARYYGLSEEEVKNITIASPMHDIGKVGVPDSILNKPGKLTQEEWIIMQKHTDLGYEIFKNSDRVLLKTAGIIAHEHHEKYDGTGYPRGLIGEDIHIYGRITALADVFDALGSERCYKKAWPDEKIFTLLHEERGKHFDPKLVDIFFDHLDEFLEIRDKYSDVSSFMKES